MKTPDDINLKHHQFLIGSLKVSVSMLYRYMGIILACKIIINTVAMITLQILLCPTSHRKIYIVKFLNEER